MFSISDLPRKDGVVVGDFRARHNSESFSLEGYGFKFVDGVTVEPVRGRTLDRLHSGYGNDVVFEPCDRESAELALAWMAERGTAPEVVSAFRDLVDARFSVSVAPPEPEMPPTRSRASELIEDIEPVVESEPELEPEPFPPDSGFIEREPSQQPAKPKRGRFK